MNGITSRLAGFAAVAVLGAALAAGCGGDDESTATETETAASSLKVGLVADAGQLNDNGFNELAFKGLKRAERELGITGRVVEAKTAADYVPEHVHARAAGIRPDHRRRLRAGRRDRRHGEAVPRDELRDRRRRPRVPEGEARRTCRGSSSARSRSATSSATSARSRRSARAATTISAVGGVKEPPVDRFIAGYKAGAEAAVPGTKVRWDYSQDWEDQAKCKELALNQIAAGSKVVFQVAGACGLGALSAAKDEAVWGIGVDGDQSFLGAHVLTSALKGVDSAVFLTIQSLQDGSFAGGKNAVFGIDAGGRRARHAEPEGERRGRRGGRGRRAEARRRRDHRDSDDAESAKSRCLAEADTEGWGMIASGGSLTVMTPGKERPMPDALTAEQQAFLDDNPFPGVVTTLREDGSPHTTVVWVDARDGVAFNTGKGNAKDEQLRVDPRVSLIVVNPQNPWHWVCRRRHRDDHRGRRRRTDRRAREEVPRQGHVPLAQPRGDARHREASRSSTSTRPASTAECRCPTEVGHRGPDYAARTEYTGGRCSATLVHEPPASPEPKTSPEVAPK